MAVHILLRERAMPESVVLQGVTSSMLGSFCPDTTFQCWHVSPRRGETGRQKYFLPRRQKYLSALVSPLWAETSQLFTYTASFDAFNSRFGTFFTLYKLSVGHSMGIGCSPGLHHSPASKGIPIKPLSSCC